METQVEGKQENQNDLKSDQSSRTKSLFFVFARKSFYQFTSRSNSPSNFSNAFDFLKGVNEGN